MAASHLCELRQKPLGHLVAMRTEHGVLLERCRVTDGGLGEVLDGMERMNLYSARAAIGSVAVHNRQELLNEDHRAGIASAGFPNQERSPYETYCACKLLKLYHQVSGAPTPWRREARMKNRTLPRQHVCWRGAARVRLPSFPTKTFQLINLLARRKPHTSCDQRNALLRRILWMGPSAPQ